MAGDSSQGPHRVANHARTATERIAHSATPGGDGIGHDAASGWEGSWPSGVNPGAWMPRCAAMRRRQASRSS